MDEQACGEVVDASDLSRIRSTVHRSLAPEADAASTATPDARFRALVEGIRDLAIVRLDAGGWVSTWHAGAERITGYAAEEIVGRHVAVLYPADARAASGVELQAAESAGRFASEGWRVRKDGTRFWARCVVTTLPGGGGFAMAVQDATEQRQAEETMRRSEARLSGIIASAMDAIISVNEEQRIVVFNAAAEAMFRCPAHDAIGQPIERFIPQRFRGRHAGHIRAFGATGVTSRSMWRPGTLTALRGDGEEFPIEATISQLETGGQRFYTVILRDITERARQEQRLHDALDAAQSANKAKADFLAMMSHELRTPLNAIGGYAQLLELGLRGPMTDDQLRDVDRIQRSQRHLLTLINNLLNYARIEAGQLDYVLGDVAVAPLLEEIADLVEPLAREKAIVLEIDASDAAVVRADADKLRQVVLNLITNAVKFTPSGGRVGVTAVDGDAGAGAVALRVWDTGRGIPPEKLERIFEPFVQVDRSLTNPSVGVGLGLTIARDLARGMGGELSVESAPRAGSTFTLTLPRGRLTAAG